MATNKVVTVTTAPTRTGDTVASYNVYTGATLLGTMTTGEAAAGKTFSLTDGVSHSISVKTVWTTYGLSTTNTSNVVVVDLTTPVAYGLQLGTADVNVLKTTYSTGETVEYEWYVKSLNSAGANLGILMALNPAVDSTAGYIGLRKTSAASTIQAMTRGTATSSGIATVFPQTGGQDKVRVVRTTTGMSWFLNDVAKDVLTPAGFVDLAQPAMFGGYNIANSNWPLAYILHTLRIKKGAAAWETFDFNAPTTVSTSKVTFTGSLGTVIEFGSNAPAVDIHAAIVTI